MSAASQFTTSEPAPITQADTGSSVGSGEPRAIDATGPRAQGSTPGPLDAIEHRR